jgi:hypothetical protein
VETFEPVEARAISAADMSLVLLRSLVVEEATCHVFTRRVATGAQQLMRLRFVQGVTSGCATIAAE